MSDLKKDDMCVFAMQTYKQKCSYRNCKRKSHNLAQIKLTESTKLTIPSCQNHDCGFNHLCYNIKCQLACIKIDATDPFKIWDENDIKSFYLFSKMQLENLQLEILELRSMFNNEFKSQFDNKFNKELDIMSRNVKLYKLNFISKNDSLNE